MFHCLLGIDNHGPNASVSGAKQSTLETRPQLVDRANLFLLAIFAIPSGCSAFSDSLQRICLRMDIYFDGFWEGAPTMSCEP